MTKNVGHEWYLCVLFNWVLLIQRDGINPEISRSDRFAQVPQDIVQNRSNPDYPGISLTEYRMRELRIIAPDIRNRFVVLAVFIAVQKVFAIVMDDVALQLSIVIDRRV